eukprot:760348-Hanusia_phi.AAC.10
MATPMRAMSILGMTGMRGCGDEGGRGGTRGETEGNRHGGRAMAGGGGGAREADGGNAEGGGERRISRRRGRRTAGDHDHARGRLCDQDEDVGDKREVSVDLVDAQAHLSHRSPKVRSFNREPDPNDPTVERIRIPLSLGPARNDLDKAGEPCIVYDCVFNNEVLPRIRRGSSMKAMQVIEQALHAKEFKEFLVGLGMGWVMEKGGGGLDIQKWNEVKLRGNYKGKFPVIQFVRADALIEEVNKGNVELHRVRVLMQDPRPAEDSTSSNSSSSAMNINNFSAARAAAENANYSDIFQGSKFYNEGKVPSYVDAMVNDAKKGIEVPEKRLYIQTAQGRHLAYHEGREIDDEIQSLILKVEMPRVETASEVDVNITSECVQLDVENKYEFLCDLPLKIDDNAADAVFDKKKRVMTLTLPLSSWTEKAYEKARVRFAKVEDEKSTQSVEKAGTEETATATPSQSNKQSSSPGKEQQTVHGEQQTVPPPQTSVSEATPAEIPSKPIASKEFASTLKKKLEEQSRRTTAQAEPRPIRGSREDVELKKKAEEGNKSEVSDRRPFECPRCFWRAAATAIRRCRRCQWCEPGSKEEQEAIEQVRWKRGHGSMPYVSTCQAKEHEKFRASRKKDEVGAIDETGGVEDEGSVRAYRFKYGCWLFSRSELIDLEQMPDDMGA